MLAIAAVWIALVSLLLAGAAVVHRPLFTDLTVTLVLYFGSPGALCFAGLTLWAHRDDGDDDPGIRARRVQAKAAITLALLAATIMYLLVIYSTKLTPLEGASP